MIPHGQVILLDSTAIIEAHKLGCWAAIIKSFRLETVERCLEECAVGNLRRGRALIDRAGLRRDMTIHRVEKVAFLSAAIQSSGFGSLDPGEKELLAHAFSRAEGAWLLSSQDGGCVRVGAELGLLEKFISLEAMIQAVGLKIRVHNQFTRGWLDELRVKIHLGVL